VGRFETVMQGADLVRTQRRLHDVLAAAGVRVSAQEVPEGHSWGSWRARTGAAIRFVLGDGTGVPDR
jgi:enterochelin esterase-like enzyme